MSLPSPSSGKILWKTDLYQLQQKAPKAKPINCNLNVEKLSFYGDVYWGVLGHKQSEEILKEDGEFLVRKSPGSDDFYTLTMRFDNKTKHFKIYYNPMYGHYLKEDFKRFESIFDLVGDGLINFYLQQHAAPIIQQMMMQTKTSYQQSPYMTLNRRKLRAISNELRKSLKIQEIIDNNCNNNNSNSNISATDNDEKEPLLTQEEETLEVSTTNNNFNINSFQEDTSESDSLPVIYEKAHMFKVNNFKGFHWCELCGNFLWGFTAQGSKCEDCGFVAHKKCSELVPPKCVPVLKRIRGIFGTDLTTIVSLHNKYHIPFIVKKCVEEVEARGMMQEGIYRISGFADEIESLKLALDKDGESTDMSESAYSNINVISGTLKLYLRLLPIPLITFQSYPNFLEATKKDSEEEMITALSESVKNLPIPHFNTLKYIIEHLNRVASFKNINKMSEYNLATVFAPTIIGVQLGNPQNITDMSQEIHILLVLITNCREVFTMCTTPTLNKK